MAPASEPARQRLRRGCRRAAVRRAGSGFLVRAARHGHRGRLAGHPHPLSEGSTTITVTAAGITHRFIVRCCRWNARPTPSRPAPRSGRSTSCASDAGRCAARGRESAAGPVTDPVLTVGATPVKRVHLTELREALDDGVRHRRAAPAGLHGRHDHRGRNRDQGGSLGAAASRDPGPDELTLCEIAPPADQRWNRFP